MEFRTLRLQIDAHVARITLSRPEVSNRVDARLLRELEAACEAIGAADSVCVTLLSADGADFCAGWDTSAIASQSLRSEKDGEATSSPLPFEEATSISPLPRVGEGKGEGATLQINETPRLTLDAFGCLAKLPCPVVAAVQGAAISAGLELALACDVRVAAHDARFALPEVGQGTLPLAGGSQRLPRIVGRAVATSMLLLGEVLDAQEAYRDGLVSRVFPAAELASEAEAIVAKIAAHGPLALRYAKEAVQHGSELSLDQALRYELDLSVILQTTRDRAEGVRAFLEKRPPNFEGC